MIAELVVRIADLVEAEGRSLRRVVIRLCVLAAVLVAVTGLSLAGVALVVTGAFLGLSRALGWAWAAGIMGLVCLALAGVVLWMSRDHLK